MTDENILVVDDDPDSVRLISLVLRREGYLVRAAVDGETALSLATDETPDLVVLDVMMPDMDGYEVARHLRATPQTADVPILMFTAKAGAEDVTDGLEAGANDYLTKPVRPDDLIRRVGALLGGEPGDKAADKPDAPPPGRVFVFLGVKGGEGTTTLALNSALALQADLSRTGKRVILAEITSGQGALGLMIDAPLGEGVPGLLRDPAQLSPEGIGAALVEYDGLGLLLTPPGAVGHSRLMSNESIHALVKGLARLADMVVIDSGSGLQAHNQHIASIADQVVLVLEAQRLSLALGSEIAATLSETGVDGARLGAVLTSRYPGSRPLAYRGIEEVLGVELLSAIEAAPELADQAIESSTPMVLLGPEEPFSAQVIDLTQALIERAEALAGRAISATN